MNKHAFARTIDHTLLRPEACSQDIARLCDEALTHQFASVCVLPTRVPLATQRLKGSPVLVCTVIGFPLGCHSTDIKVAETCLAIEQGAHEIDVVLNLGALKDANWNRVEDDIRKVIAASQDALVKVILETSTLSYSEKTTAAELAVRCGADFVKTSTGFAPQGGATAEDVRLLRTSVGPRIGVKASGGIRTLGSAYAMLQAGATRLGTSASVSLLEEIDLAERDRDEAD